MTDVTNENAAPASDAPVLTGFDALKGMGSENEAPVYVQQLDAQGRAYSTGKRKNAIARVWVKRGTGKITVNGRDQEVYFARAVLRMMIAQPLEVTDRLTQYDVVCTVEGSGLSGQAGAIRHGLSHALTHYGTAQGPEAARLPDPRQPRRRAQEVRPRQGPQVLPVLEALTRSQPRLGLQEALRGNLGRLFLERRAVFDALQNQGAARGSRQAVRCLERRPPCCRDRT